MTADRRKRILQRLEDLEAGASVLEQEPTTNDDTAAKLGLWVDRQRLLCRMGRSLSEKPKLSATAAQFLEMMIVLAQGLNEACLEFNAQDTQLKDME